MEKGNLTNLTDNSYSNKSELERLLSIIEMSNDAIIGVSLNRTITDWNKGAEQIFGYNKAETIGKDLSLLYFSELQSAVDGLFDKLPNNEIILNFECAARTKYGKRILISASIMPSYDNTGNLIGLYSIVRDVTEKHLLIQRLNEQEQRYNLALRESKSSIWEWNIETNRIDFSNTYENLLGYEKDVIPNNDEGAVSVIHPDDLQRILNNFYHHSNGEILNIECRLLDRDGEYKWFCIKGSIVDKSPDGIPTRKLGICYEINDKRQLEEELIRSEETYRLLFTSTNQGILLCELANSNTSEIDIRFIDSNSSFLNILGIEREMIIGKTYNQLRLPDNLFDINIFSETALKGKSINIEYHSKWSDKYFDVSSYMTQPGQFVLLINDITERKGKEKEILLAKQEAEKANKAKSQFLANMSHELRTPMNGIFGIAQLLELTDLSKEQRDYINTLKQSSHRLLDVINQILDISKLESEKVILEKKQFNLREVINQIVNELSISSYGKGLEVMHYVDPFIKDNLIGDELRLMQILTNLINNAVKFTDKGHIFFKVKKLHQNEKKIKLKFSVEDTGIGISNIYKEDIFTMFTQEDATYTRKYGGTGLGLAICKNLVQLMNGEIWFESTAGKGTTFHFTAEFSLCDKEICPTPYVESQISVANAENIISATILIVEDNLINQKIVCSYTTALGYTCISASDGEEALDILNKTNINLVLMDIQMPKLNGFETTALIRKNEEKTGKHVPIIAMTAYALKGDREKCLEAGMDDYLSKPFNLGDLSGVIERYTV